MMTNEYLNQRNVFPNLKGAYKFLEAWSLGRKCILYKDDEHRKTPGAGRKRISVVSDKGTWPRQETPLPFGSEFMEEINEPKEKNR